MAVHHSTTTTTNIHSFQITTKYNQILHYDTSSSRRTVLYDSMYGRRDGGGKPYDRRGSSNGGDMKSKRQERVAQIVKTELSQIIHSGLIKGAKAEYLDDALRTRISVVNTDVSPDLRQARISISIRPTPRSQQIMNDDFIDEDDIDDDDDDNDDDDDDIDDEDEDEDYMDGDDTEGDELDDNQEIVDEFDDSDIDADDEHEDDTNNNINNITSPDDISNLQNAIQQQRRTSPAVDRRRAFAWLVRNTKPIRYTLAQRMSHMKSCPDLTFVQVDVSAAVDVMYLIDKLSSTDGKYKRDNLDLFNEDDVARGIVGGLDFDAVDDDEDDDDSDWDEDDDGFLKTK